LTPVVQITYRLTVVFPVKLLILFLKRKLIADYFKTTTDSMFWQEKAAFSLAQLVHKTTNFKMAAK